MDRHKVGASALNMNMVDVTKSCHLRRNLGDTLPTLLQSGKWNQFCDETCPVEIFTHDCIVAAGVWYAPLYVCAPLTFSTLA